jgi:hypothetical protein
LHIQCPWRIESDDGILTGLSDWYVPARADLRDSEDWDPAHGGSLQDVRLRELFEDHDFTRRVLINNTARLAVISATGDSCGGCQIDLTGGYRLILFPDGSVGEAWRLFRSDTDGEHFVVGTSG